MDSPALECTRPEGSVEKLKQPLIMFCRSLCPCSQGQRPKGLDPILLKLATLPERTSPAPAQLLAEHWVPLAQAHTPVTILSPQKCMTLTSQPPRIRSLAEYQRRAPKTVPGISHSIGEPHLPPLSPTGCPGPWGTGGTELHIGRCSQATMTNCPVMPVTWSWPCPLHEASQKQFHLHLSIKNSCATFF